MDGEVRKSLSVYKKPARVVKLTRAFASRTLKSHTLGLDGYRESPIPESCPDDVYLVT